MKTVRKALIAAVGTMTPTVIAADQSQARLAEIGATKGFAGRGPATALDQTILKSALLELSPGEKLRIAGDRIRLSDHIRLAKSQKIAQPCSDRQSGCTGPAPVQMTNPAPNAQTAIGVTVTQPGLLEHGGTGAAGSPTVKPGHVAPTGGTLRH